ncbi:hypothetical protein COLO4_38446 [Corchorus olitorius]|uniref:DUF4371 domain-containing protein n=1 Tax=Corchorus olitorius TaxID=93759 RepID=A0A1R3FV76_9ROSI|nr:hypothetical protein COLO4_38446 [Corchorus olitorius]
MLINEMKSGVLTTMLVHVSLCSSRKSTHCLAQDKDLSLLDTFTVKGFRTWQKVNSGVNCPLLGHIGKGHNSPHQVAVRSCELLMKKAQHIDIVFSRQTSKEIENNRIRLKASIDCIRWLAFQGCAFRSHDEGPSSKNRGNFTEIIKLLGSYNERVDKVVLENAPGNAKYTSHVVQKEILHILASKVRKVIREEIGDAKFHVKDTAALTLKNEICGVLSLHNLLVENMRGQGYDGASNMRGEWHGLQALFLNDCPFAYYVHCFAHRLQLALVAASKDEVHVHGFLIN